MTYILYFRQDMAYPTSARMQLLARFLQVQAPSGGSGCRSEDYLYAGDMHF